MITLQPYCETRIYLPGGEKVEWRHGTLKGSVDPSVVETAKTEYEAWVIETLREMPLGAFVASGPNTPRVYVTAYPILDGPAGEGTLYYYLVDILESGSYQIARDNTDRYGLPRKNPSPIQQPLFISKQIKKEPFPRDYDEATGGYRILKHTFDSFFNTWEKTPSKEGILELEAGRYLLSSSFLRQHKASTIRIEHQD